MTELKLPLIGDIGPIECLERLGRVIELPDTTLLDSSLKNIEKALGDYLVAADKYEPILDLLFPRQEVIDVKKIIEGKADNAPLFAKVFGGEENKSEMAKHILPIWSNLMLELGEFKLDERVDKIKNHIEKLLQYSWFLSENSTEHFCLYASIEGSQSIVNNILNRVIGDDILLIIVDDDKEFLKRWMLEEIGIFVINRTGKERFGFEPDYLKPSNKNKIWVNPVGKKENNDNFFGYSNKLTTELLVKILELKGIRKERKILPVLVIDLLYKNDEAIQKIEGDNLIRGLRKEFPGGHEGEMPPLIVGFTGGKSPFVINSAVKAGADIVIMKERGVNTVGHSPGNPGGLFDLLWALSQNISKWRFLEKYKEEFRRGKVHYQPVLDRLFFSIEDESPFWRKYLSKWLRDVENLRLNNIFGEKSAHE